jgi:hypothetical protein
MRVMQRRTAASTRSFALGKAPPVSAEHLIASSITDRADVPAGTYVFVLQCMNISDPCRFTLDLTASY